MRRSAAPSQLLAGNAAKRPRFVPPVKVTPSSYVSVGNGTTTFEPKKELVSPDTGERSCGGEVGAAPPAVTPQKPAAAAVSRFRPPTGLAAPLRAANQMVDGRSEEEEASCPQKYFSVVWCKASKKKHKKWEGDAVLIARGRSVTLKDLEGKDIGKGSGYKLKDLESLEEGHTLMIGGKEIEVMGTISAEDYTSGRCFHSSVMAPTHTPSDYAPPKPFTNPVKDGSKEVGASRDLQICKPRHDPSAPNSIVMPRPSKYHQQMFNKSGYPVVDVVVDPYVAVHLRPHQKEGILFLYECVMGMRVSGQFGAILADEMGLGKTLQCICLIWTLLRQGPYGGKPVFKRALIVTPGSLVKNWRKEFQKWLGTERMRVFAVDQDHKVEDFVSSPLYSVLIISYEMLLRSLEQLQNLSFDLIICDEGHRLKNSSIKTTLALSSLSCSRRIILSGTPIQNDLQEFYALIDFVNPGILGALSAYRKIYEEPIIRSREPSANKEEKKLGDERATELGRLTGLCVLRRTQEVINKFLPPKIESIVFCRPSELQLDLYKRLLSSRLVKCCLQGSGDSSPHLVCIGALKKLCNHPYLLYKTIQEKSTSVDGEEQGFYETLAELFPCGYSTHTASESESGKLQVLTKLLLAIREHSPSERAVLVSHYTQTLNILQDVCQRHGYKCTRLDGQTPVTHRQQIVDGFNSKYSTDFIFLLSSKAGGVGLNLIGACHLILYDIDWNPANDMQAMARVWRDGQQRTVHIYRLLTTADATENHFTPRSCHLGRKAEKNISMSELMQWNHFSMHQLSDELFLQPGKEYISFVFQNMTNG
ncbi:DNA repair and recombination protein RAD54B isoform X2 [Bufo bufo]|uniref:DNA repair and recombination protein RAD54B isoform X2 n=1 Tax=Bufo bufo TaxID=8384 RepID=UPI001ABDE95A|nr:DNA repair and recombination protein RAD54B isoform X2 [Bufo bufo]